MHLFAISNIWSTVVLMLDGAVFQAISPLPARPFRPLVRQVGYQQARLACENVPMQVFKYD
jgi:hypothetical protein